MKAIITSFLLGVSVMLCIGFTPQVIQNVIFKPQKPSLTYVKSFDCGYNIGKRVEVYVLSKIKEGYTVKCISLSCGGHRDEGQAIVIMEKY